MSNLNTVARLAGVSRATAARAFSSPEMVQPATREKIYAAAQQSGFRINLVARQLRTSTTHLIGVMVPTLDNPVFNEQLSAMEQVARQAGYSLLVATTGYDPKREQQTLEQMLSRQVDGLVMTVASSGEQLSESGTGWPPLPVVLVHNESAAGEVVCLSIDNCRAMAEATRYLQQQGHTRIAMVAGPLQQSDRAARRYQGYWQAMTEAGLVPVPLIEMPEHTRSDAGYLQELLDSPQPLTAVLCSNDLLAISLIGQLQRRGIHVPRDLSVVGFDGIALGQMVTPSLCSVVQPREALGAGAVSTLLQLIQGQQAVSRQLDFEIRQGESVAAPRNIAHTRGNYE